MKPGGRKATSGLRLLLAAALAGLLLRGPAAVASADGLVGGPLPAWVAGAGSRATSKGLPAALHNPAGLAVPTASLALGSWWAPPSGGGDPAALWQQLQAALEGSGPLPLGPWQTGGFVVYGSGTSAAALELGAGVQRVGQRLEGLQRMTLAFVRSAPLRLHRVQGAWGLRLGLGWGSRAAGTAPELREQVQGVAVDLGVRLAPSPGWSLGAVVFGLAGFETARTAADPPASRTRGWLAAPRGWAVGMALGRDDSPLGGFAELGPQGAWSAGVEQRLFGGAVGVRLARLAEDPVQVLHAAEVELLLEPLVVAVAVGLPATGEPPVGHARVGLRF